VTVLKCVNTVLWTLATNELAAASQQHTIWHFFFTREFKKKMTIVPHPPYFPLFCSLKIILKGCHFDIVQVTEAESQVVLNSLTKHDLQDAFKKWQKH
jgi:hypothetical protein